MGNHRKSPRNTDGRGRRRRPLISAAVALVLGLATFTGIALAGAVNTASSVYVGVTPPVSILNQTLAAFSTTDVTAAGVGVIPGSASSVQLSVTVLSGTATSFMFIYPTATPQPSSANVRWQAGQTVTIPVTVAISDINTIRVVTNAGSVIARISVVGYFTPSSPASGTAYQATSTGVAITATNTTIVSLALPAGRYQVQSVMSVAYTGTDQDNWLCNLRTSAGTSFNQTAGHLSPSNTQDSGSLLGLLSTTGGTITVTCTDVGLEATTYNNSLLAVLVGSANGVVSS